MNGDIEDDTRRKYNDERVYAASSITHSLKDNSSGFSGELLVEKAGLVSNYVNRRRVLDIGCANGRHLADISDNILAGIGIDFSLPFIRAARRTLGENRKLSFLVADARAIPLSNDTVDCVFSFATIYHIDNIEALYSEILRVLAPGGTAILEVGNARSLATLISRQMQYRTIAQHSRRTIGDHLRVLQKIGLHVVRRRSFQILPMWGTPPRWLAFVRFSCLEKLAIRRFRGRMLDEWISSLPVLRNFAFRHLIVCVKNS